MRSGAIRLPGLGPRFLTEVAGTCAQEPSERSFEILNWTRRPSIVPDRSVLTPRIAN